MAGIGKLAKVLWKGVSYLPKKAHKLQGADRNLFNLNSNAPLTKANKIYMNGLIASSLGLAGTMGTMLYADFTDNKELEEKMEKTAAGGLIGLVAGGPIGYFIGAGLGYFLSGSKEAAPAAEEPEVTEEVSNDVEEAPAEQTKKLPPADQEAMNKFVEAMQNLEVGQTITVPELQDESASLQLSAGEEKIELKAGDKITRTEEGFEITRANAPEDDKKEEVKEEQEETVEEQTEPPAQEQEQQQPANNLFGGTINEITLKDYKVVKGDCLWNIAKRELKKANPDATITNAHILLQVKEFIRLNPQIKNPDLIYPDQEIKLAA